MLARLPIDGGAPRPVLEGVQDADWSPDGKQLAVVKNIPFGDQLEYPIGKALYKTNGWLSNVRVSPDNKQIAFLEHAGGGDDRGIVAVVDTQGKYLKLTDIWASESGLAWSGDGKEILFTASKEGSNQAPLYGITPGGKLRLIYRMAGNLVLQDTARNGDILITEDNRRREIVVMTPSDKMERDLSWLDWSFPRDLSKDGKTLLFEEQGAGGGTNYSVFIRNTDGSPAVRLGEGYAVSLSPDTRWALTSLPGPLIKPVLLPTGVGEPKPVNMNGLEIRATGPIGWFEDGNRIVVTANEKNQLPRVWILDMASGKKTAVTPEGIVGRALISPDQATILAPTKDKTFALYPVDGGPARPFPGLEAPADVPIQWSTDGHSLYVTRRQDPLMKVFLVEASTGQRKLWRDLKASDPAGVTAITGFLITPDGKTHAYTTRKALADLYLAKGLH